jgi:hypothetical protein
VNGVAQSSLHIAREGNVVVILKLTWGVNCICYIVYSWLSVLMKGKRQKSNWKTLIHWSLNIGIRKWMRSVSFVQLSQKPKVCRFTVYPLLFTGSESLSTTLNRM